MSADQPPLFIASFDTQRLSAIFNRTTDPVTTVIGEHTSTTDPRSGQTSTMTEPHRTDMANKLDPRVDSDRDNRAQYAPGTTTTGNVQPGTTQYASNLESSNEGPHSSALYNKLDPRVDSETGNTSTKSTTRAPTDSSGARSSYGSSTTAAAADPGIQDTTRSTYDPRGTGYNPSTGSGYDPAAPGYSSQDSRAEYAPSTINKESGDSTGAASTQSTDKSKKMSDKLGYGMRSAVAGIHVSGSLGPVVA